MEPQPAPPPSLPRLLGVVRRNPDYRRLFFATGVSSLGDWFNVVALFSLLLDLTGKGSAVALVFVARSLTIFLAGPLAGVVTDRYSRRAVMVTADVVRFVTVLGFLAVRHAHQTWLAYSLVVVHALASAFFEPAQLAAFPNLVSREDLVLASALENTLWSLSLALGSALGGLVMAVAGRNAAFLIDALSFAASALFIAGLPRARVGPHPGAPEPHSDSRVGPEGPLSLSTGRSRWARALGVTDFIEGARYLARHGRIRALIFVKSWFGLTLGGALVLLTIFGEQLLGGVRGHGGTGIAVMWTARGIGSFLGPLVAWRLGGDSEPALRRGITISYLAIFFMYGALAVAPGLWLAALALAIANAGGSILWTYGAALQQLLVPDQFRGRVFATDMAGLTLTMSISTLVVGRALDAQMNARLLMALCGGVSVVAIVYWLLRQPRFTRADLLSRS